ncbi:sugar phosphate nucleotidyltransferase [Candidatus Pelagibacter bacterium nBUS_44]|uniref:sugar phosphate nucleotidyltransferase n=1 Tax=Candidatus Pelagibacter bacterium nBUS_44 TaxID=3374195 RepID=UPI003EBA4955
MNKKLNIDTVVILAGGLGTRLSEETQKKPKPMVKVGSKPILWHILKHYQFYGFKNFIICTGYKGYVIKNFFLKEKSFSAENIVIVNTGLKSLTGTRLKKIEKILPNEFCLTYGDAVSDLKINKLINFHFKKKSIFTITGVVPVSKYGAIKFNNQNKILNFMEKKDLKLNYVSGGYFVLNKSILKFINKNNDEMLENAPMKKIVKTNKMYVFKHKGFWQCMDTLRDKMYLDKLWKNKPKWKIWKK